MRQQVWVLQGRQFDQANPIREGAADITGNPQCEAGFADPAYPGQRDEPVGGEKLSDTLGLGSTAYETRQIGGQVVRLVRRQ
ncbi:hypothetical protein [Rhodococcus sp. JVH1]|uniref:hypothetical protein n=1 Tax=Rhodococcus sp. JVH1 TaxID=745408 RepID=UPI001ED94F98|nr:hypothetical protein [Rhodococcus sp. JVH1]